MKKFSTAGLAALVVLVLSGVAFAHMWGDDDQGYGRGYGMGYGAGPGMMYSAGSGTEATVNIDKFKQFRKETASDREALALKKVELRNEFAKENPDADRVATLRKEIIDLQTKIAKSAEKSGVGAWGFGRGYGYGRHYGGMMGGPGNCGGYGRGGMRGGPGSCGGYGCGW
jgi:hypothetical protein